jgi:hypothetical protein
LVQPEGCERDAASSHGKFRRLEIQGDALKTNSFLN